MSQNVMNNSAESFDFTISGVASNPGVFAIAASDDTVSLFLTSAIVGADSPSVSYNSTYGSITGADDSSTLSSFSNLSVTNNIASGLIFTARIVSADEIFVSFNRNVDSTSDSTSQWSVSGNTVTAVSALDGESDGLTLTLGTMINTDAALDVTYTAGDIVDILGNALASATVSINGETVPLGDVRADENGSWTFSVILDDGNYIITATATDAEGNISDPSTPVNIAVDTVLSTISISSPTDGDTITTDTVDITGTAIPDSVIEVAVDSDSILSGSTFSQVSSGTSVVSAKTNGPTTIDLDMSQNVMNNSAESFDFTISGVASNPGVFAIAASDDTVSLFLTSAMVGTDSTSVSYNSTY